MEHFKEILSIPVFSDTLGEYLLSVLLFLFALWALYFIRKVVFKKLEEFSLKTETDLDDLLVKLLKKIRGPEYQLIAFYISIRHLHRSSSFDYALKMVMVVVFTYRFLTILEELFSYWLGKLAQDKKSPVAALESVRIIFRIIVWLVAVLFVLHNAGLNIGALLTSLGIGGVAVALAAQTILGDIFNFFVILLDKPFKKGDFIVLGGSISGTVEEIGLKSTKIRSLSGEMITVTNTKIFADTIQNYATMKERRVVSSFGVTYQTPLPEIKKIPQIIKESVEKFSKVRFDRANMNKLNSYSIDFEFVYYITDPDYAFFMKVQEDILNEIISGLSREKISLAYPTQTVFIQK